MGLHSGALRAVGGRFGSIRSVLSACRRRVAGLMMQFPPRGCVGFSCLVAADLHGGIMPYFVSKDLTFEVGPHRHLPTHLRTLRASPRSTHHATSPGSWHR